MATGSNAPVNANQAMNGLPQHTRIGTDADPTRGLPYHEKLTADLKQALAKKKLLERTLAAIDESIYKKEGEYLEETPHGNIITGFDNYIKGVTSSAVGGRKRTAVNDNDRVFSRSSVRLGGEFADSPAGLSSAGTPSGAPTPVASSFKNQSGQATPTSATSKSGHAGKNQKKGKVDAEDSEMSEREGGARKRVRK